MKTKSIVLAFIIAVHLPSLAQLSIENCYEKAQANYPLIEQYQLIEKTKEYNLANANKGYFPQLVFSAKATYQSEVTKIPIDFSQVGMPGINIPSLSKDQYNLNLDFYQSIWDAGVIKAQKENINTAAKIQESETKVAVYALNERVNQVFLGILLAEAQIKQNELLQEDLVRNYNKIENYMQNGMANQVDLDAIKIEQLKAKQMQTQFLYTKKAYREILAVLIGESIEEDTYLIKPKAVRPNTLQINRPELELYTNKIKSLEASNQEIRTSLRPQLGVFGVGGYGKPGLDMFEDEFAFYYLGGVRLSWDISKFYSHKNLKKRVLANIENIQVQRNTFLFHVNLDVIQKNNAISKYFDQLKYDDQIIKLRTSVRLASEAKIAEGILSGTDLARDIHAEQLAKQEKILHEIELLLAIYNLKFATNN